MNIKLAHHPIKISIVTIVLVATAAVFGWQMLKTTTHAADIRNFDPGNLMSDIVMSNKNTMSVQDIQNFLNSKNYCDNKDTYKAAWYPHLQYNIKDGRFVCMARESFNGKSAAQLIWQAGQDYNINPQVLIVLLEKEQGLVSDTWPNHVQYRTATGYGCPDTAPCDSQYYGLENQLKLAAKLFRDVLNGGWSNYPVGQRYVQYHPNAACGGTIVNIQNSATSALYRYTPYQPNQSALSAGYGTGDSCGAYGNRNFWRLFTDWFGSTSGAFHDGVDYTRVFDAKFYLDRYPDLKSAMGEDYYAAFNHFIRHGMKESRQAIANFDVISYKNQNTDLRLAFGNNLPSYYRHYSTTGYKEKRVSVGNRDIVYITSYSGKNYSSVYNFENYIENNADIKAKFSNDDAGAMSHFVTFGMKEGRVAKTDFDVNSYRNRYYDLRRAFGSSLKDYFNHYISNGKKEGRTAIGEFYGGVSSRNGTSYALVYDFNSYTTKHSDIKKVFGLDDIAALNHFITFGMKEGRIASDTFNVHTYKANYHDLQRAFGNNLSAYYMHYISNGHKEGRIAI